MNAMAVRSTRWAARTTISSIRRFATAAHRPGRAQQHADITYSVEFTTKVNNPNTFLYNFGPFAKDADPNLNVHQYAQVTKIVRGGGDTRHRHQPAGPAGQHRPALQPAPDRRQGHRQQRRRRDRPAEISTLPNGEGYVLRRPARRPVLPRPGRVRSAGAAAVRRAAQGRAADRPSPASTPSAASTCTPSRCQVPITKLTTDGQAAKADGSNSIIGVWATTWRRQTRVLSPSGFGDNQTGDWVQIERLGNPLVNEVVVPLAFKDHFNATAPADDAQFLPAVQFPDSKGTQMPHLVNALYGVPVPAEPRNDLVTIFLTGIPGLESARQRAGFGDAAPEHGRGAERRRRQGQPHGRARWRHRRLPERAATRRRRRRHRDSGHGRRDAVHA